VDEEHLQTLIESSDLDGLVRFVDRLAGAADWEGLLAVRRRCAEAVQRGKQLWGAAQFAEYRLALDAPAAHAGEVVTSGAGRFGLGPLWEVAASTHTWAELAPHLTEPAPRAYAAHERVIRGDRVDADDIDPRIVETPLHLEPWEPSYPVAVYRGDRADFPERETPPLEWVELPPATPPPGPGEPVDALLELVRPWIEESSGRGEGSAVVGDAKAAIRRLGPHRVRCVPVSLDVALGVMVWTGASGGAYGRRRGTPAGRAATWWALAVVLGMEDGWPCDAAELGREAAGLRWYVWDPGDRVGGWNFHLAVEDPAEGLAWAVSAVDWR
jgi:hypothetical protein